MIDIKFIREKPDFVEENLKKRNDEYVTMLHEFQKCDKQRLDLMKEVEILRHERNILTKEISEMKSENKSIAEKLEEVKTIPEKIKSLDEKLGVLNAKHKEILLRLPNLLQDVPIGKNENNNKEIRRHGNTIVKEKDHIDIGIPLGIDIERAAKITGSRFFFLKGIVAQLELALMHAALDFIINRGYTMVIPPHMMHKNAYDGVVTLQDFENVLYKIDGEDLYMIATSEHPVVAQHAEEVLTQKLKYAGFSTNFRKEAGTHGKDTKGIFRVHQFNKVEQVIICNPDESNEMHSELLRNAEDFYKELNIPFRIVELCSAEIGKTASRQYDIEAWFPAQQRYREVGSCSNCTDYQARRLNIKYGKSLAHTLNATLVTDRSLAAILENSQDGIIVPKLLQKYLNGIKKIG